MSSSVHFRRVSAFLGLIVIVGFSLWLLFRGADADFNKTPRTGISKRPGNQTALSADGSQRPTSQTIPLVGTAVGARWIEQQKFRLRSAPDIRDHISPKESVAMDVLVDHAGYFIAARRNGDRYRTKAPEQSLRRLIADLGRSTAESLDRPEIAEVRLAKIRWDDAELGEGITLLMNMPFHASEESMASAEESIFAFDVNFTNKVGSNFILMRRWSKGLTPAYGNSSWNDESNYTGGIIYGSNRYGAMTETAVRLLSPVKGSVNAMFTFIMEPWLQSCPWGDAELDPKYGDNLLTEFIVPVEYTGVPMDLFYYQSVKERAWKIESLEKAAAERKAQRLMDAKSQR